MFSPYYIAVYIVLEDHEKTILKEGTMFTLILSLAIT